MNEVLIVLISIDTFDSNPVAIFDDLDGLKKWIKKKEKFWGEVSIWDELNNQVRLAGSRYYWTKIPYFTADDWTAL